VFGSGSGLEPDSIRSVDPDPDPDLDLESTSGSRRAKITDKKEKSLEFDVLKC
jgi:hypothetical protein